MQLTTYVDGVHRQLAVAVEAGGEEALALADRLLAAVDPAVRLTLLDVIGDAAAEITRELAPGSVEVRLRGRDPEFVVTPPPADPTDADDAATPSPSAPPPPPADAADGEPSRINLRLPGSLKDRIEQAAMKEGLSVNAWLVRTVTAAVEQPDALSSRGRRVPRGGQRYTGWAR